ncbi:Glycoside hydrolase, 38 vacuolar alpha mannosidase [Lunasporangiospora selenospora]|uniref:Alpha-mannosidase n=1 Tax=Lunasporangiospora selenospora TaxID=979761 RepID=A0A9P6FVW8_9FUNG|nr:Glycoside hydrolase, 38 vacuolar alpha mannosidase [Lunasporangiospora selenospora]
MATLSAQPRFLRSITLSRATQFSSSSSFADINLFSRLYSLRSPESVEISVFSVPDLKRVPFEEAIKHQFGPTRVGSSFGPSWSTHWFKLKVTVPKAWDGERVELLWDSESEAMVWSTEGVPRQGLTGGQGDDRRIEYILTKKAKGGETIELFIEMACNGLFGVGNDGITNAPLNDRKFTLSQVEIAVPNKAAWQLYYDMQIISGMANELPDESARGQEALFATSRVIDAFNRHDLENSLKTCLEISGQFLSKKASPNSHLVTAVGNWPYAETRRKTARSWSTQLRLMEDYPEYIFVCSQAQQLEWLSQDYPKLFKEIQKASKRGQFQVTGGTWVEMDCNIPSGEALCRQFLYGQRFYEKHFGSRCKVFWLPDTFGYSAQFPNTTFTWVGLDGTKVLTHMAPAETYSAQADVAEMVKSIKNNRDLAYSNNSLLPYGNGDGGGGPQRGMLERLQRMKDIEGLPRNEMGGAEAFFERAEKESKGLQEWKGELYFELHRGTYTSQAATKRYNRKLEFLLRNIEIVSTLCFCIGRGLQYPKSKLDSLWKNILLNQFHDILPGSAIELANIDARNIYKDVETRGQELLGSCLDSLFQSSPNVKDPSNLVAFNSLGWRRSELVTVPAKYSSKLLQYSADASVGYTVLETGAFQFKNLAKGKTDQRQVKASKIGSDIVLENDWIVAKFDQRGQLTSLFDKAEVRELVPKGQKGNKMVLFEDVPVYWDAWDVEIYHLNTGRATGKAKARLGEQGPLRATIIVEHELTATSKATQTIVLSATSPRIDFETKKAEFMWDIQSDLATYDSQFGVIQRTTTYNTSHDYAKFEVCGHKFADLSEHGYGVAILNDCKYGYSCHGNTMRLSLLRSPKYPDANCDMGHHEFKYAVFPHQGTFHEANVVREAYQFNVPLIIRNVDSDSLQSAGGSEYYFEVKGAKNVILDTIKRAEDSDEIVLRLHEVYGGRARFRLKSALDIQSIHRCNILEDAGEKVDYDKDNKTTSWLTLRAFEVLSLKLKLNHSQVASKQITSCIAFLKTRMPPKRIIDDTSSSDHDEGSPVRQRRKPRLAESIALSRTTASQSASSTSTKTRTPIARSTRSATGATAQAKTYYGTKKASAPRGLVVEIDAQAKKDRNPKSTVGPAKRGRKPAVASLSTSQAKKKEATPRNRKLTSTKTKLKTFQPDPEIKCDWLYPDLLDGGDVDNPEAMDVDQTKGFVLEHILRAHSLSTHDGQDETDNDTWAVAFQPTLPVTRPFYVSDDGKMHFNDQSVSAIHTHGHVYGKEEQSSESNESEDDSGIEEDEGDDEETRIRKRIRRQHRIKRQNTGVRSSNSIAATCGGNTICLIDCHVGKIVAKYSHVPEEEFMCLAWTTLDHPLGEDSVKDKSSEAGSKSKPKAAQKQDQEQEADVFMNERQTQSNILAAAGRMGSIKLINPLLNSCYKYLHGHTDTILRMKFSLTNPRWLFSASMDGTVRLWDIGSLSNYEDEARCLAKFVGLDGSAATAIGVSEKYLIIGTAMGMMSQYNLFDLIETISEGPTMHTSKRGSDHGVLTVSPEKIYPPSQEWHESSVDEIIYIPRFSSRSYASIVARNSLNASRDKAGSTSSNARDGKGSVRPQTKRGRGGGRGKGRPPKNASRDPDVEENDKVEEEDPAEVGEFVFASRENCQGEILVWDATQSEETDAALKTILEWSITESWTKFSLAENIALPLEDDDSSESVDADLISQHRKNVLVAGSTNGQVVLFDLGRVPKRAPDGNIIAEKPSKVISHVASEELLRDVAVSQDMGMIISGDWSNRVHIWNYRENYRLK